MLFDGNLSFFWFTCQFPTLLNGNSPIFLIFSSIFHVIHWGLHIFSILFNFPCYSIKTFAFCHLFINFPCYSMETIEIFIICQFFMLFNGAIVLPNPIKQKSPCVLQDTVPFRAAALLTITYIDKHKKQGNGYRWLHIALGRRVYSFPSSFLTSSFSLPIFSPLFLNREAESVGPPVHRSVILIQNTQNWKVGNE